MLMDVMSWRLVMAASALVTLALSLGIWTFVRDHPSEKGYADLFPRQPSSRRTAPGQILLGVLKVFKYRNTGLLFIIPGGIVGCVLTFSGLWGVPYLTTHHGFSPARASALTSALLVAWGLGGPFFGWLSDRLGHRKPLYILGSLMVLMGWTAILYVPALPVPALTAIMLATGFFSGCMIVSFAFARESVPPELSGTVAGVVNMGVMLGPTILQPAVGWILDRNWTGGVANQVRVYSLEAYQSGFSLMIAWAGLSLVLLFFTRETSCRQQA
jgi:MFS family permease